MLPIREMRHLIIKSQLGESGKSRDEGEEEEDREEVREDAAAASREQVTRSSDLMRWRKSRLLVSRLRKDGERRQE